MNFLKKILKKISLRTLWYTWDTTGALKFLPVATLHWFAVLVLGATLSLAFASLAIFVTSSGSSILEAEEDEAQKKAVVLNSAELYRILEEYETKAKALEELKRVVPKTIDPSR